MREDTKRYVFVGEREYVLREMMAKNLNIVHVWVSADTYLHHRLLNDPFIEYEVIHTKEQLVENILYSDFDVLISNGCRYILPIQDLNPEALYINVHPSCLPNLRGKNPINGAFLFECSGGATCHKMDSGIDTGPVIAQVEIPMTPDLDSAVLYQLSFRAEALAFAEAYERAFVEMEIQPKKKNSVYFSASPINYLIKFENGFDFVLRQVRAFGHPVRGLYFKFQGKLYRFFKASEITNPFAVQYYRGLPELSIAMVFDNSLVFKLENRLMRFDQVERINEITAGQCLESVQDQDVDMIER